MKLPLMRVSMAYSPMVQDMPESQIRNFLIRNIANELEKMDIPIQGYVDSSTGERIHRMQLYIAPEEQFNEFVAEVRAVAQTKHPAAIDMLYSDYQQVKTEERFGQFVYNNLVNLNFGRLAQLGQFTAKMIIRACAITSDYEL